MGYVKLETANLDVCTDHWSVKAIFNIDCPASASVVSLFTHLFILVRKYLFFLLLCLLCITAQGIFIEIIKMYL